MRNLVVVVPLALLLLAGCGEERPNPMVWVTAQMGTYHTKRCIGVPANAPMKRLQQAESEGLVACAVCSQVILPGQADPVQAPGMPAAQEGSAPQLQPPPPAAPVEETQVFVTATGGKYHRVNCPRLERQQAMRLADAAEAGYTACSVCNPPRLPKRAQAAPVPPPPVPRDGPRLAIPR